jgi:glucokinase
MNLESPRLIADIDGQFARFAVESARGVFGQRAVLKCREYTDFQSTVEAYLATLKGPVPTHAAVATANPVDGDWVKMTNYHWQFSIAQTRERLGLDTLLVVNDMTALAMSVPWLASSELQQIGGAASRDRAVKGILGAGTGLGVSGLIPVADGWVALGTEGGHASFAPQDERDLRILQHAWRQYPHVSFERLLCASGLELIYEALAAPSDADAGSLRALDIMDRCEKGDPLCCEVIDAFWAMFGTVAGNLALTLGAKGGLYIGGNLAPRLATRAAQSPFRARFEQKGRFQDYLAQIPVFVVHDPDAGLRGAAAILDAQLKSMEGTGSAFLTRIRRHMSGLSPAEKRVAQYVLQHPQRVTNDPIAEIAAAAEVSQPTVIRFCRSLGCDGLSDFKLKLASGLSATLPITHAQVTLGDSIGELGVKVLGNTASAVLQERDRLNRDTLDRALNLLSNARNVTVFALHQSSIVARDAQFKLLQLGVPCNFADDAKLQNLAARAMSEGDVALIIGSAGRAQQLLTTATAARERGAAVLAITASQSPLAKLANVALLVDHEEDPDQQMPMISRVLHLLMIDVLAVGLAVLRSGRDLSTSVNAKPSSAPAALGVEVQRDAASSNAALNSLTLHGR